MYYVYRVVIEKTIFQKETLKTGVSVRNMAEALCFHAIKTYSFMERKQTFKEEIIMKKFFGDYKDLCKETGKFYKNHWKGMILMNAAVLGAEFLWFFRRPIKESLEEKFSKKEES